jgi:hypothetical protein
MEPTTTSASGFVLSKVYYAVPALVISILVLFIRRTPALPGHGKLATGVIVGGTAVGTSVTFGGAIAIWLGMSPYDVNVAFAIAGACGILAFPLVKAIVMLFDKWDGKDIIEVATETVAAAKTIAAAKAEVEKAVNPTPAAKKAPAKKVVRRRAAP